jgi:hypothetical protein
LAWIEAPRQNRAIDVGFDRAQKTYETYETLSLHTLLRLRDRRAFVSFFIPD